MAKKLTLTVAGLLAGILFAPQAVMAEPFCGGHGGGGHISGAEATLEAAVTSGEAIMEEVAVTSAEVMS